MEDEHLIPEEQQLNDWLRDNPDIHRQLRPLLAAWDINPLSEEEKQLGFERLLLKMKNKGIPFVRKEEETKP